MTVSRINIQALTPDCFAEIIKQLEEKKTEFDTYKPKSERNFKVILKNMHPCFDLTEISDALFEPCCKKHLEYKAASDAKAFINVRN